jgi:hypothetical protein
MLNLWSAQILGIQNCDTCTNRKLTKRYLRLVESRTRILEALGDRSTVNKIAERVDNLSKGYIKDTLNKMAKEGKVVRRLWSKDAYWERLR